MRLGLPSDYAVDGSTLRNRYFQLQQHYHPDRVRAEAKLAAANASANVNEAYRTLKDPLLRARHLLHLQGIEVNGDADTVKATTQLLMEVMEWREKIEDANTPAKAEGLKTALDSAAAEIERALALAFREAEWQKAAELTMRGHYLEKTSHELRVKQQGLVRS